MNKKQENMNALREKNDKIAAYFTILLVDLEYLDGSLQVSKEILDNLDDPQNISSWGHSVSSAQNAVRFEAVTREWEKVYILGLNDIAKLRKLDLAMNALDRAYNRALSMQDRGPLPLFERPERGEEATWESAVTESLLEHIDEAMQAVRDLQQAAEAKLEERR